MFSQTADYALRVVVYLAAQVDRPAKNREIAAATHVPGDYLAKVLRSLSRAGLVRSRKGLYGGSVLILAPEEISVLDVARAIDPPARIRRCPLQLESHQDNLCALHRRMDRAVELAEATLGETTIAAILDSHDADPSPEAWDADAAETARAAEKRLIEDFPRRRDR